MSNKLVNTVQRNNEGLVVAFEEFNGVFLAKISNNADKRTHAFGETKSKAEHNALVNFNIKYYSSFK